MSVQVSAVVCAAAGEPGPDPISDASVGQSVKEDGAFRTIGEAAAELGLKTHVLRFWETKFDILAPMKRSDGRRYYRPEDMETLRTLKQLLHVQGLTIRGAIRVLSGEEPGVDGDETDDVSVGSDAAPESGVLALQSAILAAAGRGDFGLAAPIPVDVRDRLEALVDDLARFKSRLDGVRLVG
jgi:DNA-binding transcriptional MerR regulator